MTRSKIAAACAAVACLGVASTAQAQSTNWTNPAGGNFGTSTNWSAGVPTSQGTARFALPGAYTVSFDASATVTQTSVEAGFVTFALNGRELTTGGINVVPASSGGSAALPLLRISDGRISTSTAAITSLEVRDAGVFNATSTVVINRSLSVSGPASTFNGNFTLGAGAIGINSSPYSRVDVLDGGAVVSNSAFSAGDLSGSASDIVVDGLNSSISAASFTLGQNGSASLTVSRGGVVRQNTAFSSFGTFRAASQFGGTATILIDGGTLQFPEVALGGVSATSSGSSGTSARMTVRNGGVVQAGNNGTSSSTPSLAIFGNSSLDLDDATLRGTGSVRVEGVLRGGGVVALGLTNAPAGRVLVGANRQLRNGSANTWINQGLMSVDNGAQLDAGTLTNEFGAMLTARNGATIENRLTTNRGSVAFTAGHVDVLGRFDNNTSLSVLTLTGGASATFYDDVINNGRITLGAGTVATFLGAYTAGPSATLTGTGTADFQGDLRPGSPATIGAISVGGDLSLNPTSTLRIKLGGTGAGASDSVQVGGTLHLDGDLALTTFGGFIPLPGDAFTVAQFGSRTGDVDLVNATGYAGLKFAKLYSDHSLTIDTSATGGDANLDAIVGFDDLVTLAQHYNTPSGANWLIGDFTHDGAVGFDDLVTLAQHYGSSDTFAADWALAQSLAQTPEPATLAAGVAGLVLLRRRR